MVNDDLSLVSRCFLFWKCVRFCFRFCCRLFLFVVCTCILCLLPGHTRCSFIDVLSWGFWNKPLDLLTSLTSYNKAKPAQQRVTLEPRVIRGFNFCVRSTGHIARGHQTKRGRERRTGGVCVWERGGGGGGRERERGRTMETADENHHRLCNLT